MPVRQRLDEVAAAERVDRVRDPRLLGEDLLGAQRDPHRLLGRQRQRLVKAVGVQRLGAAQHARQSLDRRAHDVVQRLLSRQRHTRRLRVKTHQQRPLIARTERVPQLPSPDPPRRAVLRDLLKEIDMRVEEEAQPRRELIDVQAPRDRLLDVREAVLQRERQLLRGRRTRLANVVAADIESGASAACAPRTTRSCRSPAASPDRPGSTTPSERCTPSGCRSGSCPPDCSGPMPRRSAATT